jgi:hypothetical protein
MHHTTRDRGFLSVGDTSRLNTQVAGLYKSGAKSGAGHLPGGEDAVDEVEGGENYHHKQHRVDSNVPVEIPAKQETRFIF